MSDGTRIEAFLAELERRLGRSVRDGGRVVAEVREHLLDAAAEEQRQGLGQDDAERLALRRFGSARRLARSLGATSPLARVGRVGALAAVLAGGASLAFAASLDAPPVVGLLRPTHVVKSPKGGLVTVLGTAKLARLDPKTLRPVGPSVRPPGIYAGAFASALFSYEIALASPDGREHAAFSDRGALVVYDLQQLGTVARVHVVPPPPAHGPRSRTQRGGSATDIRAAAWTSPDIAVALAQHAAPPYASRVTGRWVVRVDLHRHRVVSRTRVALRGHVGRPVSGGGWLVVPTCFKGRLQVLVAARARAGPGAAPRRRMQCPGGPGRRRARAARADRSRADARRRGSAVRHRDARAPSRRLHRPLRRARAGRDLGRNPSRGRRIEQRAKGGSRSFPGAGACLVDPATGASTRLTQDGSFLLVAKDTIVVSGAARPRDRYRHGAGLTAFDLTGKRLWHAAGERNGMAYAVGDRVYLPRFVKRHTVAEGYDLVSGRHVASLFQPGSGVQIVSGASLSVG